MKSALRSAEVDERRRYLLREDALPKLSLAHLKVNLEIAPSFCNRRKKED
jgi:hypothetical protein